MLAGCRFKSNIIAKIVGTDPFSWIRYDAKVYLMKALVNSLSYLKQTNILVETLEVIEHQNSKRLYFPHEILCTEVELQ